MTMDKLFDGSDAHLLPGNAELIERLRRPFVMSMFANRGDLYEASECERHEAADALEAADKRIAELEAELQKRAKQIGVACMTHDLTHSLACGRCLTETERKLAVAREAMTKAATLECNGVIRQALAQIVGKKEAERKNEYDAGLGTTPGMWEMLSEALAEHEEKLPESLNAAIYALRDGKAFVVIAQIGGDDAGS